MARRRLGDRKSFLVFLSGLPACWVRGETEVQVFSGYLPDFPVMKYPLFMTALHLEGRGGGGGEFSAFRSNLGPARVG